MLTITTTLLPVGFGDTKPAWAVKQMRCPRCHNKCWVGKEELHIIQKYGLKSKILLCTNCALRETNT